MSAAHISTEEVARMQAHPKKPLMIILLTIFIDLIGFSIIFPLFPALFDFYLPVEDPNGRLLARLTHHLSSFSSLGLNHDHHFIASVLFGGIFGSIFSTLQFIFAPIWGKLSDRLGRRPLLIFTVFGTTCAYGLWIFAQSFWLFLFTRVLAGLMAGNISIASASVADLTGKQNRTKGMALVGVAFSLGFMIGPAIGGLLSQINFLEVWPQGVHLGTHPFSAVALFAFLLSLLNLIWIIECFPETLRYEKDRHWVRSLKFPSTFKLFYVSIIPIRRANLTNFLFILALSGMEFTLVFFAVERFGFTPTQNGWLFVYLGLILLFTQGFLVRRLAPVVAEKKIMAAGIICGIIAYISVAFSWSKGPFYTGIAFIALSTGLITPTISALVSLYAPPAEQGRYIGSLRSAGALARALGPFLAALIYFSFNSTICYIFGALLMIPALYLAKTLPQPSKSN